MFATPRKLRLNVQTLRQLTSVESAEAVGGSGQSTSCICTTTCTCTCPTFTEANERVAEDAAGKLRLDFLRTAF